MNRTQLAFTALALLVVVSLITSAVGTAVFDGLTGSQNDDTFEIGEDTRDEYEDSLRAQVAQNPDDAASLALLANYLAQTGRLNEAIGFYERALELDPANWEARLDFARSLAESDKRNDAELQFKRLLDGQPENPQAHYYLAELYRNWVPPRYDEAAAEYQRTIETGPDTFVAERAAEALLELGFATPAAASPAAAPLEATP